MFNNETMLGKRMNTLITIFAVVLIAFLAVHTIKALGDGKKSFENEQKTIAVSGKSEMFVKPDVALISFSVVDKADSVADAQTKNTDKTNAIIDKVKGLGVEEKDIKTTDYSAGPRYEWVQSPCTQFSCPPGESKLMGYEVRQTISVKIRSTGDAGAILTAIGSAGATDISGLSFVVDDEDAVKLEARTEAIKDAKKNAQRLANELGVSLGDIVSFSEGFDYPRPMYEYKVAMSAADSGMGGAAPSIETGQNSITSNVTIVYEIK